MKKLLDHHGKDFYYNHIIYENIINLNIHSHSHNILEVLFFLDGDVTYVIEDKMYKLKKNDLIIIYPRKNHHIVFNSQAKYERYNLLFDISVVKEFLSYIPNAIEVFNVSNNQIIINCFQKLDFYKKNLPDKIFDNLANNIIKEIFCNLSISKVYDAEKQDYSKSIIQKAVKIINEDICTNNFNVKGLCKQLFISENYFIKIFKKHLMLTPKQYILQKKLYYAQEQIQKGQQPSKVAIICGFKNYSTFYRCYLNLFGCQPSIEKNNKNLKISHQEFVEM